MAFLKWNESASLVTECDAKINKNINFQYNVFQIDYHRSKSYPKKLCFSYLIQQNPEK